MIESLYIAETGMKSQQTLIEMISNNIANVATPGYKNISANFVDLVYQTTDKHIESKGIGVHIDSQQVDFNTGDLKQTGNPFDVAINGKGFIPVQTPDGETLYTRLGRLRLNAEGLLSSVHGYPIGNGIHIPNDATELTITVSGTVLAKSGNEPNLIELGQLELVSFANEQGLEIMGNNLFSATDNSGELIIGNPGEFGLGGLVQGFTEMSNVDMNEEMVNLMLAQRGYQLNARIIQASDQILDTINNLRR